MTVIMCLQTVKLWHESGVDEEQILFIVFGDTIRKTS